MPRLATALPTVFTLVAVAALLLHGPIAQPPHYHDFADQRAFFGVACAADVLSNAGFALIALWGMIRLWPQRRLPALAAGWPGHALFLAALLCTALGSTYYHLAPDDTRLIFDRLPIALACAGLLAAIGAECRPEINAWRRVAWLAPAALASVAWWHFSAQAGYEDLRPYLLLQALPLLLIPLWQSIAPAPRRERLAFALAIALYVVAKLAELNDHALFATLGVIGGHTLKHLLASGAAAAIVAGLVLRLPVRRDHLRLARGCVRS